MQIESTFRSSDESLSCGKVMLNFVMGSKRFTPHRIHIIPAKLKIAQALEMYASEIVGHGHNYVVK